MANPEKRAPGYCKSKHAPLLTSTWAGKLWQCSPPGRTGQLQGTKGHQPHRHRKQDLGPNERRFDQPELPYASHEQGHETTHQLMLSKVLLPYSFGVSVCALWLKGIRGPFHHAKLPNTIPYQIPPIGQNGCRIYYYYLFVSKADKSNQTSPLQRHFP